MLSRVGPRPPVFRRQSSLPLPPRCEPFRARRSVTISESFEWLQSGSSPSVVSLPPSRSRSGSPRSGSLSPRSNRSDSLSKSFSPAAIDRLCEIVDGAKVKFLGTPVFSQGDKVIVSFPGAHGRVWNRLMQGAGGWKTSCVFLPNKSTPGYGVHATRYSDHKVEKSCFCRMLYGDPVEWGCRWFQMLLGKQLCQYSLHPVWYCSPIVLFRYTVRCLQP